MHAGKPQRQAVAIAYAVQRKAKKHFEDGGSSSVMDSVKNIPDEFMRGVRRVGQDLGIAKDPNQYAKTPQGEAISKSDFAKGARNTVRAYKEGLGMKDKNDTYEAKGGKVKSHKSSKVKHPCW